MSFFIALLVKSISLHAADHTGGTPPLPSGNLLGESLLGGDLFGTLELIDQVNTTPAAASAAAAAATRETAPVSTLAQSTSPASAGAISSSSASSHSAQKAERDDKKKEQGTPLSVLLAHHKKTEATGKHQQLSLSLAKRRGSLTHHVTGSSAHQTASTKGGTLPAALSKNSSTSTALKRRLSTTTTKTTGNK